MTNYLATGAELLQQRMEAYAGITVLYRRVNPSMAPFSITIVAVPGRNPVDLVDSQGVVLRGQVQDFIFSIEKLRSRMLTPDRPMRGDEIVATLGDRRVVFLVNGEDFSRSHYEPADSYGKAWRVHTRSDREE